MIRCVVCGLGASVIGTVAFLANRDCAKAEQSCEHLENPDKFEHARKEAEILVARKLMESGSPGLSVTVHRDGRRVWSTGMGLSDVENLLPMTADSVLRVASISKSLTMAAVARAVDRQLLDVSAPVQRYLPDYPQAVWQGHPHEVTTDMLVRNRSGIRHYHTKEEYDKKMKRDEELREEARKHRLDRILGRGTLISRSAAIAYDEAGEDDNSVPAEFLLSERFGSVGEALELFKNDELVTKPGSKFHYSTHGWTLISAVLEKAVGSSFEKIMTRLFDDLAMKNTYLDRHSPLIPLRGRYYVREKSGRLMNAPYVDTSYKWAGGGVLSTSADLCRFADVILYSWQHSDASESTSQLRADGVKSNESSADAVSSTFGEEGCNSMNSDASGVINSHNNTISDNCSDKNNNNNSENITNNSKNIINITETSNAITTSNSNAVSNHMAETGTSTPRPYLSSTTARWMWHVDEKEEDKTGTGAKYRYARGWFVSEPLFEYGPVPDAIEGAAEAVVRNAPLCAQHTGGAVGCSSVLLVLPSREHSENHQVHGVCVAIIANLQSVSLHQLATEIAHLFSR